MDMKEIGDLVSRYEHAVTNSEKETSSMLQEIIEFARSYPVELRKILRAYPCLLNRPSIEDYIAEYSSVLGEDIAKGLVGDIKQLAQELISRGKKKVVLFNATYTAGGVAEMMPRLGHILSLVGIDLEWQMIRPSTASFYDVTKKMHDIIQGANEELTKQEWAILEQVGRENFELFSSIFYDEEVCAVFFEDPQVVGLMRYALAQRLKGKLRKDILYSFRLHIDVSGIKTHHTGAMAIWSWIRDAIRQLYPHEKAMFQPYCVPEDMQYDGRVIEEPPGIDPLAPKNRLILKEEIFSVLDRLKVKEMRGRIIPVDKASIVIGARLDGWKGLFESFLAALPIIVEDNNLQLILFGNVAPDAPDGRLIYEQIQKMLATPEAGACRDRVFFVESPAGMEVGVLYRLAALSCMPYIAYSLKEGYNLMVVEAVMQGALILVSNAGGLRRYKEAGYRWLVPLPEGLEHIKDPSHIEPGLRNELVKRISTGLRDFISASKDPAFRSNYEQESVYLKRHAYITSILPMARDYLRIALGKNA